MKLLQQRQALFSATQQLTPGKSGNVSLRVDDGFLITPSGIANAELCADQLVFIDKQGQQSAGQLLPSSEWRFHHDLYQSQDSKFAINAIVHTHSTYATTLACHRKAIPAFHYMVCLAGGDTIPCTEYATFGTQQLSNNILAVMQDRKACLMANHGLLAVGKDLAEAISLAEQVEELAKQYVLTLQIGDPVLLSAEEMKINLEKFKTYGKQPRET